ncbi:MAG TPA: tetratricopeptide repeat protein [Terriglobia bacterium]|nr:tetratricopeptide repeat protein [Terriglobia bacterium]
MSLTNISRLILLCALAALPGASWTRADDTASDADQVSAHLKQGGQFINKRDWDAALGEYREAVRISPNNAEAHIGAGRALGEKGDKDGALAEFKEALRLKPDSPEAHNDLGWVVGLKGDYDGAAKEYQEAIRLKPGYARAHENLAWALTQKGETEAALREYREAVRLMPKDAGAHIELGTALARKGAWSGSIAEQREAIRLDPNEADAHADLAFVLGHQGDWDGDIREAREAIRLQPSHAQAHFFLGRGLEHQGDRRGALEEYHQASKLAPDDKLIAAKYDRLESDMSVLPGNWSPAMVRAFTISAALVPSFLLLGFFRARDLYPEPARALWATFFLGALSIIPVLMLDWPLDQIVKLFHGPLAHGLAEAFFTAALPEELLKFAVVVFFCARLKAFNEPMDGIVYGAVASLGFATLENIGYVTENGMGVAICRAFTSVPGHAFMGAVMGYFVGQWRFGLPAQRAAALLKAYLVPMSLHWLYDFPLLAYGEANKLAGPAKHAAVSEIAPLMIVSLAILALETIWGVRLVNRLRREQIQFVRDAVSAEAAAEGAMDIVALVNAPDAPPSAWPGWLMTLTGGLVATCGGFISLLVVILFVESRIQGSGDFDLLGATMVGGIPLLIGLMLFVYGVRRIHASTRRLPPPAVALPASA